MNNGPIGIFDSGLGGLSVWREIRRALPDESLLYYGDGKHCPYGSQPKEKIRDYSDAAVAWLLDQGAKLIVVACNTATAASIRYLRAKYDIPIVGMEPAVKPAALSTRSGVIAILATEASLHGELFHHTAARYAENVRILSAVGTGFVELVEESREDTPEAYETVRNVVEPLLEAGADRLVLGCTHYPFLAPVIRRVIGSREVELIDPAPAIERRVAHLLQEYALEAEPGHPAEELFYTLADESYRQKLIAKASQTLSLP